MASVDWKKCKTANDAKALFRHDEKDKRAETKQHSNPHIDKSRTHLNFSCVGRSYAERCAMYDAAVSAANERMSYVQEYTVTKGIHAGEKKQRKMNGLKKDAVTCLSLETAAPAGLSDAEAPRWFTRVHEIMCDMFGADNVIDTDVHFDEQHEYIDSVTHDRVLSRIHSHTMVLPMTADGRMCAKEICNRANMVRLNNAIEDMSQREFGMAFNTGEYAQRKSVEQLKGESLKAENEMLSAQIAALVDIAEKAPKRKLFARGEQYVMSKEEHDEYMQMVAEMRTMSQATLATEEDRKAAAKARRSAERMRREAEQMKKQEDKLIQERAEQLAKQAIGKAQEREREAEQMRETYREQFKAIVQDPFEEFKKKIEDKQHMQEMANKIKQSIDDLQLQTGISRRIVQSMRDELEDMNRK